MKKDVVQLVIFHLGADSFAAEVFGVERVLRYTQPSSVPGVPRWIEGVMPYRDTVIPVVDMRHRIELPEAPITPETRILVFTGTGGWVGVIVDSVSEVAVIPAASLTPPPPLFHGLPAHFMRGIATVGEQVVIVLDIDRVLTSTDRIEFERIMQTLEPAVRA
ncbi:MAG TPA: chemotaxis protein CheW [Gemmatimonadaceae bacterium]|nr:chemotaxis protein CheW [Gemmatimonadaceae bacterium]